MSILSNKYKIVAKSASSDVYLISNKPDFDWETDLMESVYRIDNTGKVYESMRFNMYFRDENDWQISNESLNNILKSGEKDIVKDGLLGFAVGDAFGVPVEFMSRSQVRQINLNDMLGNDTNNNFKSRWGTLIPSGSYSDDTAMLVATMDSLNENNGKINNNSIMNNFIRWWNEGMYSSLSFPFGLGGIVMKSLENYSRGMDPLECGGKEFMDNGNGSLMRILPFSLYCIVNDLSEEETEKIISDGSSLTHANDISKMSCFIYTEFLRGIIEFKNPNLALHRVQEIDYSKYFSPDALKAHSQLLRGSFEYISDTKINESGYVVDTLESAIYSIIKSKDYESAVKTSVNLGYDTDTVGGVTGSIAGILYGSENIPERWINKLRKKDYLEDMASKFNKTLEITKEDYKKKHL